MPKAKTPTWGEMNRTAKAADVNWRTVRRMYRGEDIRPSTRARIVAALKAAGMAVKP